MKNNLKITPISDALGAEIKGADLSNLTDKEFDIIHRAWLDHCVVLLRNQELTDKDLITFSQRFGELDWAPVQETGRRFVEGYPEIYVISNVVENGEPIGSLGAGEAVWHTDMSYLEEPPKASMVYALEVPPIGGSTFFCNMYTALELLPDTLKEKISGLRLKHDGTYNSGGYLREGVKAIDDPVTSEGVYHPIVCKHPETNQPVLYLGRRRNAYIESMTLDDSNILLDELWTYATHKDIAWGHVWKVGDVVLWDNRCTMHRRDSFDPDTRRVLHRTQVKGQTKPTA
ncbi:MAG: taurine catabolism dioxygenase TauD [Rhodospirillaceae bacterium]|nr:taurine catabolism dioxygenase TauD [Rhodospirillaceae bacterium]|tara:strand:+ start:14048 stop:14908 length:861 start_codon:yes stop_codon:yes gene_type:complete